MQCVAIQLCCYARAIRSVIAEPAAPRSLPLGLADAAMIAFFTILTITVAVDPDPLVRVAARAAVWLPM